MGVVIGHLDKVLGHSWKGDFFLFFIEGQWQRAMEGFSKKGEGASQLNY